MQTVYWDFFWALVLYSGGGITVAASRDSGWLFLTIPIAVLAIAGAATFTLSAILRGVAAFF